MFYFPSIYVFPYICVRNWLCIFLARAVTKGGKKNQNQKIKIKEIKNYYKQTYKETKARKREVNKI